MVRSRTRQCLALMLTLGLAVPLRAASSRDRPPPPPAPPPPSAALLLGLPPASLPAPGPDRRHEEFFASMLAALEAGQGDPWEHLDRLEQALPGFEPELAVRLLATARARSPEPSPALLLVEGVLASHGELPGLADPRRARQLLGEAGRAASRPDLATAARLRLAVLIEPTEPEAARALLRQVGTGKDTGATRSLEGLATLMLGRIELRLGNPSRSAQIYRIGLRRFAGIELEGSGRLEPFFHHGLADALDATGNRSGARAELEAALRFEAYPARWAAEARLRELAPGTQDRAADRGRGDGMAPPPGSHPAPEP